MLTDTSFGLAAEELDDGDREWFEENVLQVRECMRMMDLARPLGAREEGSMDVASWVQDVLDAVGDAPPAEIAQGSVAFWSWN